MEQNGADDADDGNEDVDGEWEDEDEDEDEDADDGSTDDGSSDWSDVDDDADDEVWEDTELHVACVDGDTRRATNILAENSHLLNTQGARVPHVQLLLRV